VRKFLPVLYTSIVIIIYASFHIYLDRRIALLQESYSLLIKKNCSVSCLAYLLKAHNISNRKFAKLYFTVYEKCGKHVIAGEYLIDQKTTLRKLFWDITKGRVIRHTVTIPEGLTLTQIVDRLGSLHGIIKNSHGNKFQEGNLFPSTYQYIYNTKLTNLLDNLHKTMHVRLENAWRKRDMLQTKILSNKNNALILASIIEKEAKFIDEKPMIASVYLNRLRIKMPLQADPTVIYGINKWTEVSKELLVKDLQKQSPYNTYLHKGLPPTPICSPGATSIEAVMHPATSENLYFVLGNDGRHNFSSSFSEHVNNKKMLKYK
jgi:UPF0755 protein